jgi:maltose alpha-D-glucosyltransferase/alpha-amylase
MTIALLLQFVPSETDAWSYTLDNVERSLGRALTLKDKLDALPEAPRASLQVELDSIPTSVRDFIGSIYLEMAELLGQRTAELHLALASLSRTPEITSEPFSLLYQKSLYQSVRGLLLKVFGELEDSLVTQTEDMVRPAETILGSKKVILKELRRITEKKISAMKIRTHGDYHLGQVLYTGRDFIIIDFEGEPARPITERHLKQSALRDVAGMMRSFHYAAHGAILLRSSMQGADTDYLRHWADLWYFYVSGVFLSSYMKTASDAAFVPQNKKDFAVLLETLILEKAIYELGYELNNRPDWIMIPIRGIEHVLKGRF